MTLAKINPTKINTPIYQKIPLYEFKSSSYTIADLDKFKVYNQKNNSNCVVYVMKFLAEYYIYKKMKGESSINTNPINISVNSLYYEARINDEIGKSNDYSDTGTTVYGGLYALSKGFTLDSTEQGKSDKEIWTNIINPPLSYFIKQKYNLKLTYGSNLFSVNRKVSDIKYYLHFNLPIVFSIKLNTEYSKFESIGSKIYSPELKISRNYSIHCLIIVGYDESKKSFFCRNSYGTEFGKKGYFYMHYSFLTDTRNLINDMFVII